MKTDKEKLNSLTDSMILAQVEVSAAIRKVQKDESAGWVSLEAALNKRDKLRDRLRNFA